MAGWRKAMAGLAVFLGVTALAVPMVSAQTTPWRAALVGTNEVPPVTTTATGTFTATLDETAGTLAWTLVVPTITSATQAHIHSGATGVNGPIVVNLFAAPTSGPVSTINVSGTARAADVIGPLAGNFAGLVSAIKAGTAYVNVHTSANAGGEIRAQIGPGGTPTPTATATATATATPTATATAKAATPTPTAAAATATVIAAPKSGTGFGGGDGNVLLWTLGALAVVSAGIALGAGLLPRRR